jgi:hypothetical protein
MTENPAPAYFNARRAFVSGTGAMLGAALLGVSIESVADCPATRSPEEALHDRTEQRDCTRKPERRRSLTPAIANHT